METTQTDTPIPTKRRPYIQICAGLALSLSAFLFGGFAALPAAIAVIPGLRRLWPFGLALFIGVICVRGTSLAGFNPVLNVVRDAAITQMEEATGGTIEYDEFEGDAPGGLLKFTGLRGEAPGIDSFSADELTIHAGFAFLIRGEPIQLELAGVAAKINVSSEELQANFEQQADVRGQDFGVSVTDAQVTLAGMTDPVELVFRTIDAEFDADGWTVNGGISHGRFTVNGQPLDLQFSGGVGVSRTGDGFTYSADALVYEEELGRGVLRGTFRPGRESAMVFQLDWLNLEPLWSRYRKIDQYFGAARGKIEVSGDFDSLIFDFRGEVIDYEYYHRVFMDFDDGQRFRMRHGALAGRIGLLDGERILFDDVTLITEQATLATDPKMKASGSGKLTLNGEYPALRGELEASVTAGAITQPITWSPANTDSLDDIEPNLVLVGEQFPALDLRYTIEVKDLAVQCAPLEGKLEGRITGSFKKTADSRVSTLRAGGHLDLVDGKFEFLGASGTVEARLKFKSGTPTYHAVLEGELTGSAGEVPLAAEISGSIMRPVFVFSGVTMRPDKLGRHIFEYSGKPLTPAELAIRREDCARLCGGVASVESNPFLAKDTRKVYFSFKP